MARLTQPQIAMYARSAGMANPALMAAIAMAESRGNTHAHNPIPPDNSYGLWQINMIGKLGPARRKEYGISSNSALFDPGVNALAAAKILKQEGLSAWSTYTNGEYEDYLRGTGGVTQADIADDLLEDLFVPKERGFGFDIWEDPYGDPFGLEEDFHESTGIPHLNKLVDTIGKTGDWLSDPRNWIRILYVAGGSLVMVIALSGAVKNTQVGQQVISATKKVVTKGMA